MGNAARRSIRSPAAGSASGRRPPILPAGLLALGLMTALASSAAAQPSSISREHTIKAGYLGEFGKFVTWPNNALAGKQAPFVIGMLGPNPFGQNLDKIARTKQVQGRQIEIRQFLTVTDYNGCHILFVGNQVNAAQRAAIVKKIGNAPVLVVGETPGFALTGAVINFFVQQNKVRFEINPAAAARKGLKISSKLMQIAATAGRIIVEPAKEANIGGQR